MPERSGRGVAVRTLDRGLWESVENAVDNDRIVELLVPLRGRHLRSKEDGTPLIAVIADFQEVAAFSRTMAKSSSDENRNAREFQENSSHASVMMRHGKFAILRVEGWPRKAILRRLSGSSIQLPTMNRILRQRRMN